MRIIICLVQHQLLIENCFTGVNDRYRLL